MLARLKKERRHVSRLSILAAFALPLVAFLSGCAPAEATPGASPTMMRPTSPNRHPGDRSDDDGGPDRLDDHGQGDRAGWHAALASNRADLGVRQSHPER